MSSRELVTENDPLGAFETPFPEIDTSQVRADLIPTKEVHSITDDPVLFKSSVHRSATFEGSPPAQSKLQRSETVPAASVTSSLASLGSTFKLGFRRYSPSRLSLRKADLKTPQLFFENAINNFSPSSLTSKKSNELIQGGLSSIKNAATSMVKKMGEIKEVISTSSNSTPVKVLMVDRIAGGDNDEVESNDGSDAGERHRRISGELGSYKGSCTNLKDYDEALPDNLFQTPKEEKVDCHLELLLTTCSECHHCSCLLYDEDIMANWSAEDSNLNTLCQACNKPTVPFLTISAAGSCIEHCDPFSVPYLNPLVLRKELENVLSQEGDLCLSNAKFVDEHPIIYWNLIWVFERINVQTHLPNLYLRNKVCNTDSDGDKTNTENNNNENSKGHTAMKPVEEGTDPLTQELTTLAQMAARVHLRCHWDDPTLHSEGPPMYILWKLRDSDQLSPIGRTFVTKTFMQQIINYIRVNDLVEPLKILANGREEESLGHKCTSVYRDILFLACKALGRAQIDINAFDKEYTTAYYRILERHNKLFPQDRPINLSSLYCRQFFRPLSLS